METRMGRTHGRECVESSTLHGVCDLRVKQGLPLVWLEWNKARLPSAAFPCVMQRHDVRYCVRREIRCGECVSLFFETHMNDERNPVYRIWVQVGDLRDTDAVVTGVGRALDGLGIGGG